jgi:hypothetical protein
MRVMLGRTNFDVEGGLSVIVRVEQWWNGQRVYEALQQNAAKRGRAVVNLIGVSE